ncbi:MAG: transporter substrate-binding domain-containing protein [Ilumatobacter sp.]
MQKSRVRRVGALIVGLSLIVAACGDDEADSVENAAEQSAEDPATDELSEDMSEDMSEGEGAQGFDLEGQSVTVAVENAYLPFNYMDPETGDPAGWDYEAIDTICGIINCTPEYKTFSWEPMIQAVADGQFDMAADGITITDERAEVVDYSDGYINIEQRLLVRLDSEYTSVDDVIAADCQVASQIGTTNLQTGIDTFGEARMTALEEFGFVVQSVIAGDACAAVIDETAGQGYVGQNADEVHLIGDSLSSDQLGFIFTPGSDLVEPFNFALDQMKADGSLESISSQYFGDSFTITYDDIADPAAVEDSAESSGETEEDG